MKRYNQIATRYIKENKSEFLTVLIPLTLTIMILITSALLGRYYVDKDKDIALKREGNYDVRLIDLDNQTIDKLSKSDLVDDYALGKSYGVLPLKTELDYRYGSGYKYNKVELYGIDEKAFQEKFLGFNLKEGRMPENSNEVIITSKTLADLVEEGYNQQVGQNIDLNFESNRTGDDYLEFDATKSEVECAKDWAKIPPKWTTEIDLSYFRSVNGNMVKPEKGEPLIENKNLKIVGIIDIPKGSVIWEDKLYTVINKSNDSKGIEAITKLKTPNTEEKLAKELGIKFVPRNDGYMKDRVHPYSLIGSVGSQVKYRFYDEGAYKTGVLTNSKTMIMLIFTLIFSCLAIYTSFNITINKRIRYFGTLRALGATKGQIINILLRESVLVGILAIPIGTVLALVLLRLQLLGSKYIFNVDFPKFRFSIEPNWVITSAAVVLIILLITALMAVRKSQGLTPIEALRNTGISEAASGEEQIDNKTLKEYIEKDEQKVLYKILKKLFNVEGSLAYKNLNRNMGRNFTGIITLAGGIFLIQCFIFQFINGKVASDFATQSEEWNCNVTTTLEGFNDSQIRELKDIDGVGTIYKDMKTVVNANVNVADVNQLIDQKYNGKEPEKNKKEQLDIRLRTRGLDENAVKILNGISKEKLDNDGVVIVNDWTLCDIQYNAAGSIVGYASLNPVFNYKIGDNIKINTTNGEKELEIVGMVDKDILFKNLDMRDKNNLTEDGCILVSDKVFGEITGLGPITNSLLLDVSTEGDRNSVISKIEKSMGVNVNVNDAKLVADKIKEENNKNLVWNVIFASTTALMILISIANILMANILSRKKELAALSSIGMEDRQRTRMIICESFVIAFNACFSVFLIGTMVFTVFQLNNTTQGKGSILVNMVIILTTVISVGLMATFLGIIPLRKISKMNIAELIKSE